MPVGSTALLPLMTRRSLTLSVEEVMLSWDGSCSRLIVLRDQDDEEDSQSGYDDFEEDEELDDDADLEEDAEDEYDEYDDYEDELEEHDEPKPGKRRGDEWD